MLRCRLKRAGLDYWASVCVDVHPSWDAFYAYWQQQPGPKQLVGESGQLAKILQVLKGVANAWPP